jgi:hypothetical protein
MDQKPRLRYLMKKPEVKNTCETFTLSEPRFRFKLCCGHPDTLCFESECRYEIILAKMLILILAFRENVTKGFSC